MPFGGLVVNRVHPLGADDEELDEAALAADLDGDEALARKVARTLDEFRVLAHRDAAAVERLRTELGDDDPILVPDLASDVHDIDGLLAVHAHLLGGAREGPVRPAALSAASRRW
jgi:hypothetical protein